MSASSSFPRRLVPFTGVVFFAATAGAVAVGLIQGLPSLEPLLILGALVLVSAHRGVGLPNGAYLSPSFMVCAAALVIFQQEQALLGAIAVGMLSGVYFPSLTRKSWGWIPFNVGINGLAMIAASLVYAAFPAWLRSEIPAAIAAILPAALVYIAVVWMLIVGSYVVEQGRAPREVLGDLQGLAVQVIAFALVGLLLGRMYLTIGPGVVLLIVVPMLIAREAFAAYMRVKESHDETVQLLIRALEQKDPYTAGHAERVAVYAGYVGEELEFMPARMDRLRFAVLMHDIGKLVVPNQLLNKPGRLTEEEFARVRIHEGVSVQMLSHIDFLRPIAMHAHSDTMKFDPDDLDHPIEPYVIMVADVYDAMTSTRSYRKALEQDVAFQELRDKAGTQFHPECAEALIRAIEKRNEVHGKGHEEDSHFENAPEVGLGSAGLGDLLSDEKAKK